MAVTFTHEKNDAANKTHNLMGKCLEKNQANKAEGILVVPLWTCQSWYPKLLRLLVAPTLMITHRETLLTLPGCQKLHPLRKKLNSVSKSFMRRLYKNRGYFERATNIVLKSLATRQMVLETEVSLRDRLPAPAPAGLQKQ
ncbi:uncharacterized protein LOC144660564 [Oculina patagonica]